MMARAWVSRPSRTSTKASSCPDNVIIDIVQERLSKPDCANGFILDGMPRTIPQAEALIAHGIELDSVLSLEVSDEDIVERMAGRASAPAAARATTSA